MHCIKRCEDIRPETSGVVIAYIERNPGKRPGTKAGFSMPGTEEGCLSPSCRGNDEGEWAFHNSVQSFRQSWARDNIQAQWRDGELRCKQVEGWHADCGGARRSCRRLRRIERVGQS